MNQYEPSVPRAALALAALALTAVTMAAVVLLPAQVEAVGGEPATVTARDSGSKPDIRVAVFASRSDARCDIATHEARD